MIGPLLLVIAAICGFGLKQQRDMLSDGRAALATITSVKKHRTQHGSYNRVGYKFSLLSGAVQTGSANTSSKAPDVGSSFAVLYDAENPSRSRAYPLSLVQLAEFD